MSTAIIVAKIISIQGSDEIQVRGADQQIRTLKVGDPVLAGDTILTTDDVTVQLGDGFGESLLLPSGLETAVTEDLFESVRADAMEAQLAEGSADALIESILAGGDFEALLEETAAGAAGAGGEGNSFVRLSRISEGTDPTAFNAPGGSDQGAAAAAADDTQLPPEAVDDDVSLDEDTSLVIDILANDSDPNGDPLELVEFTQPTNGSVVLDAATGLPQYTPNPNYNGPDSFEYTIQDPSGQTSTASVNITVIPVNDAPVANPDARGLGEDSPGITGNVITAPNPGEQADVDIDGDTLTVSAVSFGNNAGSVGDPLSGGVGTLTLNEDGSYSYVPNDVAQSLDDGEIAVDLFVYTVTDSELTSTTTLSFTVTGSNDAPVAEPNTGTLPEDSPIIIPILNNDNDPDGDPITVTEINGEPVPPGGSTPVNGGEVTINPDGTLEFEPEPDFNGEVTFTYTIDDGDLTDEATVTLTVTPVNDAPIANPDEREISEDGPGINGNVITAPQAGEQADFDVDGDGLSVVAVSHGSGAGAGGVGSSIAGSLGTLVLLANGNYSYVPNAAAQALNEGETATDIFTYTVSDGELTDSTSLTVTVVGSNDGPNAVADSGTLPEDSSIIIPVLNNDSDADGDPISVVAIEGREVGVGDIVRVDHGRVEVGAGGNLEFSPDRGYNGPETFTYTISDGSTTDTATVSLNVSPVNDGPDADPDFAVLEGDDVTIDVLANDDDPEGDDLEIVAINGTPIDPLDVVPVDNGTVTVNEDGTVTFTPDENYDGETSFEYTISDGEEEDTSTVTVTGGAVNEIPVAIDDAINVSEGGTATALVGGAAVVQANDTDAEDGTPGGTVTLVDDVSNGSLTLNPDGSFSYTHDGSETTSDSFTYQVTDSNGEPSNTATVNITVGDVNDPPEFQSGEDSGTDTTPNADSYAFSVNENATGGTAVSGAIPVASFDVDGDEPRFSISGGNSEGLFTINELTGVISVADGVTLDDEQVGGHELEIQVSDQRGGTDTADVTITVNNVNDAPVAIDDAINVSEGGTATALVGGAAVVQANDTDAEDGTPGGTVTLVDDVSNGSLTLNPDGSFSYTHDGSETTSDSFTYQVTDSNGEPSNTATVNITVGDVNDPPEFQSGEDSGTDTTPNADSYAFSVNENATGGTAVSGAIPVASFDVDGDEPRFSISGGNSEGLFTINELTGVISVADGVTLDDEQVGGHELEIQVSDQRGGTDTADVTITVNNVNDAPVAIDDAINVSEGGTATALVGGAAVVQANDTDAEDGTPGGTVTLVDDVSNGSLTLNPDGSFSYTHDGSETTSDSFTYQVTDSNGEPSNTATVNITVGDVNDPPEFQSGEDSGTDTTPNADSYAFSVNENATGGTAVSGAIPVASFDVDGDEPRFSISGGNSEGLFTINELTGVISVADGVTLDDEQVGGHELEIQVSDQRGGTDTADVTITVGNINDAPEFQSGTDTGTTTTANDDVYTAGITQGDTAGSLVDAPAFDVEGDTLTYSITTNPDSTLYDINSATGEISLLREVTQADIDAGAVQLSLSVTDGALSDTAVVNVGVTDVNDAPEFQSGTDTGTTTTANDDVYTAGITQGDTAGSLVDAPAFDLDGDTLTYSITTNPDSTLYDINSATGEISLLREVTQADIDAGAVQLSLSVTDGALSDTAVVNVGVTDVNDAPEFQSGTDTGTTTTANDDVYTAGITQGDTAGSLVDAPAFDLDGDTLTYSITTNPDSTLYDINSATGEISLLREVTQADIDAGAVQLSLSVTDGALSDTAVVNVGVTDVNDAPEFQSGTDTGTTTTANDDVYTAGITQGDTAGSLVDAPAFDLDGDTLTYSITTNPDSTLYDINSATGEISLLREVTQADIDAGAVQLSLSVTDGALSDTAVVNVGVTDVNDAPEFQSGTDTGTTTTANDDVYTAGITQGDTAGSLVDAPAFDLDGDTLTYSITTNPDSTLYDINSATGEISLLREVTQADIDAGAVQLSLSVTDGALSDTAVVNVGVTDVNDAPEFQSGTDTGTTTTANDDVYTAGITQGDTAGSLVDAPAFDLDGDTLTYSITTNPDSTLYDINSATGEISLLREVTQADIDAGAVQLSLSVTDGALSDTAVVNVGVTDVNDAPEFQSGTDTGTTTTANDDVYTAGITQGDTAGSLVDAPAFDLDGDTLTYSITTNPDSTLYDINSATGEISLLREVTQADIDAGAVQLSLSVTDGALSDTAVVNVGVTDVNDAPEFQSGTDTGTTTTANDDVYTAGITQGDTAGSLVDAPAFDLDGDTLTYSITTNPDSTLYDINSATGEISLLREVTQADIDAGAVQLSLSVTDGALSDTAVVNVGVTDVNDAPEFQSGTDTGTTTTANDDVYTAGITQGDTAGSLVDAPAFDVEGDTLTYSITTNPDSTLYDINSATGEISLLREVTQADIDAGAVQLSLSVTDGALSDTAVVNVGVTDVNDAPEFQSGTDTGTTTTANDDVYTAGITQGDTAGSLVDAPAFDLDGDTLTYSITTNPDSTLYDINSATGEISLLREVTQADIDAGAVQLSLSVTDGALSDTAVVNVGVTDVNDAPEFQSGTDTGTTTTANDDVYTAGITQGDTAGSLVDAPAFDLDGDTLTYSITTNPDSTLYDINSATGEISLLREVTQADIDAGAVQLSLSVTDGALSDTAVVNVGVTDVNDAPEFQSGTDTGTTTTANDDVYTAGITQGDTAGSLVDAPAFDLDGDTLTYSITTNPDSTLYDINSATGEISLLREVTQADIDAGAVQLSLSVTDGALSDTAVVNVGVTDVNDAPSVSSETASVSEEGIIGGNPDLAPAGQDTTNSASVSFSDPTASGAIIVTDPDASDTHTLTLTGPVDGTDTSNNVAIVWRNDPGGAGDGSEGSRTGATLYGFAGSLLIATATINNDGEYTFTLDADNGQIDHLDSSSEDTRDIVFGVTADDGTETGTGTLTITVEDDSPIGTAVSDEVVNGADTSGQVVSVGADQAGAGFTVNFDGTPPSLTSGGVTVTYSGLGEPVLTASAGDTTIFELTIGTDGSYEFDQQAEIDLTSQSELFSGGLSASGPEQVFYLDDAGQVVGFGDLSAPAPNAYAISITASDASGNPALVNPNSGGIGIGNGNINPGSYITIDFDDEPTSADGIADEYVAASIDINNVNGKGEALIVVHYVGTSDTDTHETDDTLPGTIQTVEIGGGGIIDYVEVFNMSTGGGHSIRVNTITTFKIDAQAEQDLNFLVNGTDGDGDPIAPTDLDITITNPDAVPAAKSALLSDPEDELGAELFGVETLAFELADNSTDLATDDAGSDLESPALNLADLLHDDTTENLGDYLHFESDGANTVVSISNSGGFANGYSPDSVDHKIVLEGVEVESVASLGNDLQVIQDLLSQGNLYLD